MKIIISESQLNLLKETSYVDMDEDQLYDRAVKLKGTVDRRVSKELSKFYWFDNLKIQVENLWFGPNYHIFVRANDEISDDDFLFNTDLKLEVYGIIANIFEMYFPPVNKHTRNNETGIFDLYLVNNEGEGKIFFGSKNYH